VYHVQGIVSVIFLVFVFMLDVCGVTLKCTCSSLHIRGDAVNYHSDLGDSEGGTIGSDEDVSISSVFFLCFYVSFSAQFGNCDWHPQYMSLSFFV
jgi:hypothetical protein